MLKVKIKCKMYNCNFMMCSSLAVGRYRKEEEAVVQWQIFYVNLK